MVSPLRGEGRVEEEERREEDEMVNGLEQTFCSMKFRENIDKPSHADIYNPQGERLTSLNSQKLLILNFI